MTDQAAYLAADAADRRAALAAATEHLAGVQWGYERNGWDEHCDQWLHAAGRAYRWLRQRDSLHPVALVLIPGPITKENTVTTSLNLQDDQEVSFTLGGTDDKGIAVDAPSDTWAWSSDDTAGAIVTLAVSDDTTSATVSAVAPGTATISVSGSASGLQGAEAIVVTAGPAVSINLVAGTPSQEDLGVPGSTVS